MGWDSSGQWVEPSEDALSTLAQETQNALRQYGGAWYYASPGDVPQPDQSFVRLPSGEWGLPIEEANRRGAKPDMFTMGPILAAGLMASVAGGAFPSLGIGEGLGGAAGGTAAGGFANPGFSALDPASYYGAGTAATGSVLPTSAELLGFNPYTLTEPLGAASALTGAPFQPGYNLFDPSTYSGVPPAGTPTIPNLPNVPGLPPTPPGTPQDWLGPEPTPGSPNASNVPSSIPGGPFPTDTSSVPDWLKSMFPTANWGSLITGGAKGLLDYLASGKTSDALASLQAQARADRMPALSAFNNALANPNTFYESAPAMGATDAVLRKLSMQGNPALSPGALSQAAAYNLGGYNDYLRALSGPAFGTANTEFNIGTSAAGSAGYPYTALGTGIGAALTAVVG